MSEATQSPATAVVKHADSVKRSQVAAGTATDTQLLLGPGDGAPNFAMRRFTMGRGGGIPRHTNTVEHEQYVLRGRAQVMIGAETYDVSTGDVLYIPAAAPHSYEVTEAPFEFLCIVPNAPDKFAILDDGSA